MIIKVDYNTFITRFKEFKDFTQQEVLEAYKQIGVFISPVDDIEVLATSLRINGVYLATAVICKEMLNLTNPQQSGGTGVISGANEGSDGVSFVAPPIKTISEWDLLANNLQPYGKMLLRILRLANPKMSTNKNINVPYYWIK